MPNIIKSQIRWALLAMTLLTLSACGDKVQRPSASEPADSASYFSDARETGQGRLKVLYVPAPGFAYENEEGQLSGVSIAIMNDFKAWFERYHGVRLQLDFVAENDWSQMYQRVANGNGGVFGLGNVTITEQRREQVAFSPAYLHNVAVLITPEEVATIEGDQGLAALADLEPVAFAGTLHEVRVGELRDQLQGDTPLQRVDTNQAVIDHVVNGHYSYIDAYNYHRAIEQGVAIRHHPAFSVEGERFGIIMPKDNDWQSLLTAFFAAEGGYLKTGRYQQVLQEHLGEEVAATLLQAQ
ncbi:substrate-binding periplasmic protein [Aliidiomarina soli]|uniref:Amino acid ABC transporter substrate-binding protein n=1 Tax=Aliidiomarina soli TaxID=1928574 RepID=A0A432WMP2_9GAMM|nr:transporter substrate-binding domain-containing protein [Aliidiomarina soli]RUO34957.1 amino acid ABC transporter substrate-binding protein [Aliidiomarina soli]